MKNKSEKHLSLRIDEELLKKFRFVCEYDGRSANGQLLYLVRHYVSNYEREHGSIKLEEKL